MKKKVNKPDYKEICTQMRLDGFSRQEIADKLGISTWTVSRYSAWAVPRIPPKRVKSIPKIKVKSIGRKTKSDSLNELQKGIAKLKKGEFIYDSKPSIKPNTRPVKMNDSKNTIIYVNINKSDSQARIEWAIRTEAKMKF